MIYFRADANSTIASGHIMRCLSIANYLREHRYSVCFLIADKNPIRLLKAEGIQFICLESQWDNLLTEVEALKDIFEKDPNPLLLIDTYQVNKKYVEELLPYTPIWYLGSKQEYLGKIQGIINYSTDINLDFYKNNYNQQETSLLLGPQYAPLRKEFHSNKKKNNSEIKSILITTGNTDPNSIVSKILVRLQQYPLLQNFEYHIIVGSMFAQSEQDLALFEHDPNVHLYKNVPSMAAIMSQSDVAITANGTTVYELAAMQVPIISFAMVNEQVKSAQSLSSLGVLTYCGNSFQDEDSVLKNIENALISSVKKPQKLYEQARKANHLINGKGCELIIQNMLKDYKPY